MRFFGTSITPSSIFLVFGVVLLIGGAVVLTFSYAPLLSQELHYQKSRQRSSSVAPLDQPIQPVDTQFGIVIPKIEANAPIVSEVDPFSAKEYQRALAKGVAHARDTGLPGTNKTMFLFAHASGDILLAQRYNSIFYLLGKMKKDDEIQIYYQDQPFRYQVTEVKVVAPDAVDYLANVPGTDLILMTCTPPGTTWKRLLVMASKIE